MFSVRPDASRVTVVDDRFRVDVYFGDMCSRSPESEGVVYDVGVDLRDLQLYGGDPFVCLVV